MFEQTINTAIRIPKYFNKVIVQKMEGKVIFNFIFVDAEVTGDFAQLLIERVICDDGRAKGLAEVIESLFKNEQE